ALIGHTDPRGSVVLNQRLGMRRATAVRDYLVRAGVEMARLVIESAGKAVPTAHGTGLREYALNRRVEIQYSAPGGVMLDVLRQGRSPLHRASPGRSSVPLPSGRVTRCASPFAQRAHTSTRSATGPTRPSGRGGPS